LTPGRDQPEGASAWELRGYAVGRALARFCLVARSDWPLVALYRYLRWEGVAG